jgi:hypothetical protein
MGYKSKFKPLSPVAIKCNQSDVHAPVHDTWGTVACAKCKDEFVIGSNHIYGSRSSAEDCAKQLQLVLAEDHRRNRPHENSYKLEG